MLIPLWVQFAADPRGARLIVPAIGSMFAASELAVRTVVSDESITTSQFGRPLRSVKLGDVASVAAGAGGRRSRFWSSGPPLTLLLVDGTRVAFPWLRGRGDVANAVMSKVAPDA